MIMILFFDNIGHVPLQCIYTENSDSDKKDFVIVMIVRCEWCIS